MRTKLAGLITIIAALGAVAIGAGTAGATTAVSGHHVTLAAASTPDGDGSGEGPNH